MWRQFHWCSAHFSVNRMPPLLLLWCGRTLRHALAPPVPVRVAADFLFDLGKDNLVGCLSVLHETRLRRLWRKQALARIHIMYI